MFLVLLILASLVNLVAALGPELGFDALWYHLTMPKIWMMWGKIDFIPGGLLYYSAMPRLGEFLYMGAIGVMGEMGDTGAHLIGWGAGIGAAFLTFKIARKYLDRKFSFLAALIFYATPLVGWQSGSAYIDLLRTFFEALALYFLLSNKKFLSGIAAGLAVSTKTLALGSLGILGVLSGLSWKFFLPAFLISAPWFVWAYLKTGYLFYPLGAGIVPFSFNWAGIGTELVSPIYLILLPFFLTVKKPRKLTAYFFLSLIVWLLIPHSGEGRFLLPYLPAWAVLAAIIIQKNKPLIFVATLIAVINIGYRAVANFKVVPYLLGQETKTQYLCKHLDFSTAVFVDCDGWFAKNIKKTDLVLVKGFHNLYYIDFPFVHETWYKGEKIDYVLEYKQNSHSPADYFSLWSADQGQCLAGCDGAPQ